MWLFIHLRVRLSFHCQLFGAVVILGFHSFESSFVLLLGFSSCEVLNYLGDIYVSSLHEIAN